MRRPTLLALCLAAAVALAAVHQARATCSISSRGDKSLSEYVFSNAEKAAIVERHDWYKIHTPEAVDDMMLYTWDNNLEATARVWAKKCYWGHSENSCRTNVAGFSNTGENLASGYGSPYEPKASPGGHIKMVENWAGERAFYHWIGNSCDSGKVCGHYTQMVWHDSSRIGCAMTQCPADTIFSGSPAWYLVCHYGTAGNWNGQSPAHLATSNACAQGRLASGASRCGEYGICVMSGGNYHCECEAGYYSPDGTQACIPGNNTGTGADVCHPATGVDPCSGHGVCTADALAIEGYRCICSTGWTGLHCETALNPCSPNPCANGKCTATATGTYTCACNSGWTGAQCNTATSPCASAPCANGGVCKEGSGTYTCTCGSGWTGATCQQAVTTPASATYTPSDAFMKALFKGINDDRKAGGKAAVSWIQTLESSALSGTTSCPQYGRSLTGQSESVTRICGFAGNALPADFAATMIDFWKSYNAWWAGSTIKRVACAFKQGAACSGDCSGMANWKPLDCIYAAGTTSESEETFMVSWDHPMLYGHAEMEVLSINFHEHYNKGSFGAYAAIAAAGVVAAAAAVGLAVLARRRRTNAAQAVEYVELTDQLA